MTVLVEKSATTLEDGIENLLESAITDYKKRYGDGLDSDVVKKWLMILSMGLLLSLVKNI